MNASRPPVQPLLAGYPLGGASGGFKAQARRIAWRWIRIVVVTYLVVLLVLSWLQTSLIFPGASRQGARETQVVAPAGAELVQFKTADGEAVAALFGAALTQDGRPHPDAARRPTILFFYGNGMWLAKMPDYFDAFRRLGANVLMPEYVGYGQSSGSASEAGCYATADAAYAWLAARDDIDTSKVIVGGWSLGAAVAVDLAAREKTGGLMMWSAFTSVVEMAQKSYPFFPVKWVLRHKFDSLEKIKGVKCPMVIAHGRLDTMIPCEMADRLAAEAGGPVTHLHVEDASHNDFMTLGARQLMASTSALVEQVMQSTWEGEAPAEPTRN